MNLGSLWLDVKVEKKHISLLKLSSLYPKTKFRTASRYFKVIFYFITIFFPKINGSAGSGGSGGSTGSTGSGGSAV